MLCIFTSGCQTMTTIVSLPLGPRTRTFSIYYAQSYYYDIFPRLLFKLISISTGLADKDAVIIVFTRATAGLFLY